MILDLTAKFVKKINELLNNPYKQSILTKELIEKIIEYINKIQESTIDSEVKINKILNFLNKNKERPSKITLIVEREKPLCIIGTDIIKHQIKEIKQDKLYCQHNVEFIKFNPFISVKYIENLQELIYLDNNIIQAAIKIFDHDYRSYKGYTCYILIGSIDQIIYIIDAIKFREEIPKLKMMKCGVPKIFHCRDCVYRFLKDFKQLGCYRNLVAIEDIEMYIDWRIRPLPKYCLELMCKPILKTAEAVNGFHNIEMVSEIPDESKLELKKIISEGKIPSDDFLLIKILNLRRFLAKNNDESVYYVMTDEQLISIYKCLKKGKTNFFRNFRRISPLLREHINDFICLGKHNQSVVIENTRETNYNNKSDTFSSSEDDKSSLIIENDISSISADIYSESEEMNLDI